MLNYNLLCFIILFCSTKFISDSEKVTSSNFSSKEYSSEVVDIITPIQSKLVEIKDIQNEEKYCNGEQKTIIKLMEEMRNKDIDKVKEINDTIKSQDKKYELNKQLFEKIQKCYDMVLRQNVGHGYKSESQTGSIKIDMYADIRTSPEKVCKWEKYESFEDQKEELFKISRIIDQLFKMETSKIKQIKDIILKANAQIEKEAKIIKDMKESINKTRAFNGNSKQSLKECYDNLETEIKTEATPATQATKSIKAIEVTKATQVFKVTQSTESSKLLFRRNSSIMQTPKTIWTMIALAIFMLS